MIRVIHGTVSSTDCQRRPVAERKTLAGHVKQPARGEIDRRDQQEQQTEQQPRPGEKARRFHPACSALRDARGDQVAQRRAGARRVVGRPIGPVLDLAGERPGDAGLAHRFVKPGEFRVAAGQVDDMHRLAGCRGLADHRHRIGGDDQRVGDREIGEIGVLSGPVPDLAGNSGQTLAQQPHAVRPGAPRRGRDDRAAAPRDGGRDPVGDLGERFLIEPVGAVGAADQHADDRPRQACERRKAPALGGETRRRHAMDGALRDQHARAAQAVVLRHDQQVEAVAPESRVLDMRRDRPLRRWRA